MLIPSFAPTLLLLLQALLLLQWLPRSPGMMMKIPPRWILRSLPLLFNPLSTLSQTNKRFVLKGVLNHPTKLSKSGWKTAQKRLSTVSGKSSTVSHTVELWQLYRRELLASLYGMLYGIGHTVEPPALYRRAPAKTLRAPPLSPTVCHTVETPRHTVEVPQSQKTTPKLGVETSKRNQTSRDPNHTKTKGKKSRVRPLIALQAWQNQDDSCTL